MRDCKGIPKTRTILGVSDVFDEIERHRKKLQDEKQGKKKAAQN